MSGHTAPAACPACGAPADLTTIDADGMFGCPNCGHRCFSGYLAEYSYLDARRRWLHERLMEQSGPPDPATASAYGVWPASGRPAPPPPAAPVARGPGSGQMLLISIGAFLLILAGVVFLAITWQVLGPAGRVSILVLGTLLLAGLAIVLRHRVHRTAEALAVVAFALAVVDAIAAPEMGLFPQSWLDPQVPYLFVVCLLAVGGGVLGGRRSGLRAWSWLGWLSTPFLLASTLALASRLPVPEQLAMTGFAAGFLLLAAALVGVRHDWLAPDRLPMLIAAGLSLATATMFTLALLGAFDPPVGAIVTLALVLLLLLVAHERTGHQSIPLLGWPLFGLWLALLGTLVDLAGVAPVAGGLIGTALLFALGRLGPVPAVTSAGTFWTAWLLINAEVADAQWQWFFGTAAVGLFGFSLRRGCASVAWLGALAGQVAWILLLDDVDAVEIVTLPFAALLLAAGLVGRRAGASASLITFGPGLAMALVPSALMVWDDIWSSPALLRFLVVMLLSVIVLLLGVRRHLLGLVAPASAAIAIAASAQIFASLDALPRWLALGIAGAVLLVVGARIEWVRGKGEQADAWLHTLR